MVLHKGAVLEDGEVAIARIPREGPRHGGVAGYLAELQRDEEDSASEGLHRHRKLDKNRN